MTRFVARRLAWTIAVLLGVSIVTFGATELSPVDPARAYVGPRASQTSYDAARERFGLNDPLPVRYGRYLSGIARGDLGVSYHSQEPVGSAIARRLPATASLAFAGLLVAIVTGLVLGMASALLHRSVVDRGIMVLALVGAVTPYFVLGFFLLYQFAFVWPVFPIGGRGEALSIVLPAITLGLASGAWYARVLRSTLLTTLGEDFVRTARAKGLRERIVIVRHVLRASAAPIVSMVGVDLGVFLGGVLVVEKVFAWPGIGSLAWEAVQANDTPFILGTVLTAAAFITLMNLAADVLNGILDPRIARR